MPLAPHPKITEPMRRFINECEALEPDDTGDLFPYADKSGYHNTVERNLDRWPGEYSTRLAADLRGNRKVCRAFDWISESARTRGDRRMMNRYGRRVRDAFLRRDPRLVGWREVLTQVDAGQAEGFDFVGWYTRKPDISHDYHHHFSVTTEAVDRWLTYAGMLSILADETLATWLAGRSRYQDQSQRKDTDMQPVLIQMPRRPGATVDEPVRLLTMGQGHLVMDDPAELTAQKEFMRANNMNDTVWPWPERYRPLLGPNLENAAAGVPVDVDALAARLVDGLAARGLVTADRLADAYAAAAGALQPANT